MKKAILSINSIYATAIYAGLKKYEIRKTSTQARFVYLYETMPKGLVTGYMKIEEPIYVTLDEIEKSYINECLITPAQLKAYANGKEHLWLWPVKFAERLEPIKPCVKIPHGWCYIYEYGKGGEE